MSPCEFLPEGDTNAATARASWLEGLSSRTLALLDRDAHYFLGQALSTPCLNGVEQALGSELIDLEGQRILDFHGNNVHHLGYGHPEVVRAVVEQLQRLPFSPRRYTNAQAVDLAARLSDRSPIPDAKVLFARGAAEAASIAIKVARAATGRYKTVGLYGSFHGATLDALSLGGQAEFLRGMGPVLPGSLHVPEYNPDRCFFGCQGHCSLDCLSYLEEVVTREGDVAMVMMETIRNTDVRIPPPDYYARVQEICRRAGCLFVLDETAIAWGRTGKLFAIEHYPGVEPDMIVVGKGLGAGLYPISALMAHPRLDVVADRSVGHFTFEKSPVGAAAGLAMLEVVERDHLCEQAVSKGESVRERLEQLRRQHPMMGRIRHLGLLLAFDILDPASNRPWHEAADALLYAALRRGLSFKVSQGFIVAWSPPLVIEPQDLERAVAILDEALTETAHALLKGRHGGA